MGSDKFLHRLKNIDTEWPESDLGAEASVPPQYHKSAADVKVEAEKDAEVNKDATKDVEPKRSSYPTVKPNDNIDDILGIG